MQELWELVGVVEAVVRKAKEEISFRTLVLLHSGQEGRGDEMERTRNSKVVPHA